MDTRRIAFSMASSRLVGRDPWRLLLAFGLASALMSSVMSHVVTTMIKGGSILALLSIPLTATLGFYIASRILD